MYFHLKCPFITAKKWKEEKEKNNSHICSALTSFTFCTLFSFFASILTRSINKVTLLLVPTLATSFWTLRPIRIVCTFWKKCRDIDHNKLVIYFILISTQHTYPCFLNRIILCFINVFDPWGGGGWLVGSKTLSS